MSLSSALRVSKFLSFIFLYSLAKSSHKFLRTPISLRLIFTFLLVLLHILICFLIFGASYIVKKSSHTYLFFSGIILPRVFFGNLWPYISSSLMLGIYFAVLSQ